MTKIPDPSKITDKNRFSSTFLVGGALVAGCMLMIFSNDRPVILYTGLALVVIAMLLILDAYSKAAMKEHYESIKEHYESVIEKLNGMLKDSRGENKQNKVLINETIKTMSGQSAKQDKSYTELVE